MVWPRITLPTGLLTCKDIPQADAPRAVDCLVRNLDHVENGKARADQSQGQSQEEEKQNCYVEASVELLHQVWEDWGEKTQPLGQCQRSAQVHEAQTCLPQRL